jgi:hypothetical protein
VVRADATVSVAPVTSEVCIGGTAILTATISGGSLTLTQQWQSSADGTSGWTDIPGATATTYSAPTTTAGTTYYRIIITDPASDCSDPISNVVNVIVQPDATISIAPLTNNVLRWRKCNPDSNCNGWIQCTSAAMAIEPEWYIRLG